MKYKQIILIRTDLKMGKGKMCAQAAHASIISMSISDQTKVNGWLDEGMRKIVLKIESEEKMIKLYETLKTANIKSHIVHDFGLTQVDPYSATAIGIEILEENEINKYIIDYKLL